MLSYVLLPALIALLILFIWEMRYSLRRSTKINKLANKYAGDFENAALIEEIYEHCVADRKLKNIMAKHQAGIADIAAIYQKLLLWANFKKGRRFVPIASFFFVYSLNWLLGHKDDEAKKLAMRMMNFFHI